MKKNYITPSIKFATMEGTDLLAASGDGTTVSTGTTGDNSFTGGDAKRYQTYNVWDDSEEDFE
ncbi:MAG: hypothetical protein I3J02_07575 [Prevotella sp.]|nr:hypothetical protein [Prevotella sp.]